MKRVLLAPLARVYAAALRAKNARYDRETPRQLSWPVVSVGNLSVGGSGKTPLVILLAQRLTQAGWSPDVLSRGYGRDGSQTERVDAAGDPRRFGDEPVMIAQAAQVPIFLAASRYQAGLLAERELPVGPRRVHLLDDGFQHRQLARAVNIVAIHRDDLQNQLLPAGRLREPLESLKRADVIVLREEDADLAPQLAPYVRLEVLFWQARRRLALDADVTAARAPGPTSAIAFCAIARPEEFFRMLDASGITRGASMAFRDHHRYTLKDMEALRRLAVRSSGAAFITTEKDAVKLHPALRQKLAATAPLRIARLTFELADEHAAIGQLLAMLERATG